MPELAPEVLDEIVLRVAHVGGQPQLVMQMRRTVYAENGLVLANPRHEPLPESYAIDVAPWEIVNLEFHPAVRAHWKVMVPGTRFMV